MELLRLLGDAGLTVFLLAGLHRVFMTPARMSAVWQGGDLRDHYSVVFAIGITSAFVVAVLALSRALTGAPRWLGYFGL